MSTMLPRGLTTSPGGHKSSERALLVLWRLDSLTLLEAPRLLQTYSRLRLYNLGGEQSSQVPGLYGLCGCKRLILPPIPLSET